MRVIALACACTLLLAGQVSSAIAAQPGVHIDPGSPAGKQYAIPIVSARGEAGGQTGSQSPPAFGVGITPPSGGQTKAITGGRTLGPATTRKDRRRPKTNTGSTTSNSGSLPAPAAVQTSAAGGSGWLALTIGGMLVLILGGAGGMLLRRRLS